MEFLQNIYENSEFPFLSAFILGLMTAISPCPLATNITAVGFISKEVGSRRTVFLNGIIYTLGRAVTYTGIGLIFYFGASKFLVAGFLQQWGEKLLGPLLLILGILMLDVVRVNIPVFGRLSEKMGQRKATGFWGVLLLGIVFALAFCPYSGVLYFGMLIPITISSTSGLYLPLVFAIATGIPVIILAWFIAFSVQKVGTIYNRIKLFEKWFRQVVAGIFIVVGIYYIWLLFIV